MTGRVKCRGLADRREKFERQLLVALADGQGEPAAGLRAQPHSHAPGRHRESIGSGTVAPAKPALKYGHRSTCRVSPQRSVRATVSASS